MPKVRFLFNRGRYKSGQVHNLSSGEAKARLAMGEVELADEPTIDQVGDVELASLEEKPKPQQRRRRKPTETATAKPGDVEKA